LVWQKELAYYNRLWDSSNDQIVYIVWLYTKSDDLLPEHRFDGHLTDVSCHHHGQGDGAVKHRRLCKKTKVGDSFGGTVPAATWIVTVRCHP
jgi:hypothetical protein